jgi:hypothetical protein
MEGITMREIIKPKLSELPDEEQVSIEYSSTKYTVAELKHEILVLGEPHHQSTNWLIVSDAKWKPDAETMFEQYRDNVADDMFENFDEHVNDQLNKDTISKLQAVLDEAFGDGIGYWNYGKAVEIDIFPPNGSVSDE